MKSKIVVLPVLISPAITDIDSMLGIGGAFPFDEERKSTS